MPTSGADDGRRAIVEQEVARWRDSLINLTGSNRLLTFRAAKTSTVAFSDVDPDEILSRLLAPGAHLSFAFPVQESVEDTEPAPDVLQGVLAPTRASDREILCRDDEATVTKALRNLLRRSTGEYMDRGLWVLYLAVGTLRWVDVDGSARVSPLLLVPVALRSPGPKQPLTLELAPEEPLVNPALVLKLREFELDLPELDELTPECAGQLLDATREAVSGRRDWEVRDDLNLSYFSFHKEAMYRDLLDNVEEIVEHPFVQAFALGGTEYDVSGTWFDPIPNDQIDEVAPPERTPLVLDADSSQRACVAAAVQGKSFVVDGPPGTGKSQTITNVIAGLLNAGKSVLFVSEKIAALEVVQNRLREVGLDAYVQELHSHKATRKEFATELGRALLEVPVPPAAFARSDRLTLETKRTQLSAYARAVNEVREPFGFSLHRVLGSLAELHTVPRSPAPSVDVKSLDPERLAEIRGEAARISRAWRPARQGRSFVWRGLESRTDVQIPLSRARRALSDLADFTAVNSGVADAFGMKRPSDTRRLADLIHSFEKRDERTVLAWLEKPSLTDLEDAVARLDEVRAAMQAAANAADEEAGRPWQEVPTPGGLPLADVERLNTMAPTSLVTRLITRSEAAELREQLRLASESLDRLIVDAEALATQLHLDAPTKEDDIDRLLRVADACLGNDRPPATWLTYEGESQARAAFVALREAHRRADESAAAASEYFTSRAIDVDAELLGSRFANVHRGLRKLSGEYRVDRRALAEVSVPGVKTREAVEKLPLVVAWREALRSLAEQEAQHATALGDLYMSQKPDWAAIERALDVAEQALADTPDSNLAALALVLGRGTPLPPGLGQLVSRVGESLTWWRGAANTKPLAEAIASHTLTLRQRSQWIHDHDEPLVALDRLIGLVSGTPDAGIRWIKVQSILERCEVARHCQEAWVEQEPAFAAELGPWFARESTNLDEVVAALAWTRLIQSLSAPGKEGSALTSHQVKALEDAVTMGESAAPIAEWERSVEELVGLFAPDRSTELLDELDDYAEGIELLEAMQRDEDGPDEWFVYSSSMGALEALGLARVLQFCAEERVEASSVPLVVEKAVLAAWADALFATDPALEVGRSADRDALVAEFRRLDEEIVHRAVADVLVGLNARRPTLAAGQTNLILREASKQKRHMPVRKLVADARDVIRSVKPCFMMSPLSVSQYLPSDLRFDVVVFDEASQVTPEDAINCIYRGDSVIIAGDQKQLPPTNFFTAAGDDGDDEWVEGESDAADFKSVLDIAKSSGAMPSLTLKWHYRSRHEHLIAFSNASFYDGRLITFPGALHTADHVGVELIKVPGVYRRGSTSDNPLEAAAVAERVIHHFTERRDMTLGVVAFSEAQATAIERAVEDARALRPDLDECFADGRLDGFFIKNLESVQGDERDVMIFSIGYGPDEHGKIWNNFGPLNREGGWRRLNVAITRARFKNEIVSSIGAADITASTNESVRHFRRYLDYAERGIAALALGDAESLGPPESPFEESVLAAIRGMGYDVTPQVGAAGYRIDMAVSHPNHPGVYMLGVECDGLMYHSSKTARDRDRLRQQVLEGLGWTLHRIWGTAWYRHREQEEERLRTTLSLAAQRPVRGLATGLGRRSTASIGVQQVELLETPEWAEEYTQGSARRLPAWLDPGSDGAHLHMKAGVEQIVEEEGPIHRSLLNARLRSSWDIGHIGSKIQANIDRAIRTSQVVVDGDFLRSGHEPVGRVRVPAGDEVRTIAQVPDDELEAALLGVARDSGGLSKEELSLHVARLFGWQRRGSDITRRLELLTDGLLEFGALEGDDERLVYVDPER